MVHLTTACSLVDMQARKEQNSEIVKQLEGALKAAMEEKQKTLRPEIQLLNNLLAVNSRPARKQVSHTSAGSGLTTC